ncbi:hypothetical protein R80B4_01392 [Fibrobacteres bacterium R8-0-B4]
MRRAAVSILTALTPLLLVLLTPLRADAGGALLPDTVSSCPSVIKNAVTAEMLMSEDFLPWDVTVGVVDPIGTVDTISIDKADIINIDTVDIVSVDKTDTIRIDTVDIVSVDKVDIIRIDTINTVSVDKADIISIDTADTIDKDIARPSFWRKHNIKFGRRAAFNHSQVSNVLIRIYKHDGDNFMHYEYRNRAGFGIGFEVAGIVDWVLSDALTLNVSPGVVFRKPVNTAVVGTSEVGLSIPVLAEWAPFGGIAAKSARGVSSPDAFAKPRAGMYVLRQLRLFGGIFIGAPVYAWVKWNGEESAQFNDRAVADFGLVCGVGLYVSERAFVDVRGIFGLSGYDGVEGRRLNQLAIGVNYVK